MRMNEDRLLDVVAQIYEAAAEPERLASLVDVVMRAMDIDSSILFLTNHRTGELVQLLGASANFDPKARADYRAHYHGQNPWYQVSKNKPGLYVKHGGELIEAGAFEKTEFRADWCKRVGIYHFLGGTAPVRDGLAVAMGLHKPARRAAFSEEEKRVFTMLLGHIVRACQLADKIGTLASREAKTYELLSRLNVGFALLDPDCRVLHVNGLAEGLVKASRWLTYSQGRIAPVHPRHLAAFQRHVRAAAMTSSGQALGAGASLAIQDPIEAPLAITFIPFRASGLALGDDQPAAAIVFSDPDSKPVHTIDDIALMLGLTPAEARLVSELSQGRTLVDAAAAIGVSANTAKSQLKSVFLKTGCKRQSELAALVAANPFGRLRASS